MRLGRESRGDAWLAKDPRRSRLPLADAAAGTRRSLQIARVEEERSARGSDAPPRDAPRGFDVNLDCLPHNSGATRFESPCPGAPFATLADRLSGVSARPS
jgi:hypothetical protein